MKYISRFLIVLILFVILTTVTLVAQLTHVGGFEGDLPSYWTKGNEPGGSTLTWATDQYRSMGRSLKITKSVTTDSAAWISENAADFWSPVHSANTDILVGAYIRTEGVNTSPANDDERWYVSYVFYDSSGALIGETKLPIDQSVATSGAFIADTNAIGQTILPVDSWTTIMKFVGGKDATGTVWADDFMFYGRGGAWAGQNWNTSVGVPDGWIYWLPPIGGNDGRLSNGFENTIVTTEEAYSGLNSLKFDLPFTRGPQDAWVGTKRFLFGDVGGKTSSNGDISNLESVSPGDVLRISVWIKASNLVPDSAAAYPTTWAAGFTYGFWTGNGNNDGWNSATGGDPVDMQFVFPAVTSFDWTQYNLDVTVPDDPNTRAISVRLHAYSRFTGTVYFDDLTVEKLDVPALTSEVGGFEGDLPSYWTKGNEPGGSTLTWATDQYRSMGRSLKITKSVTTDSAAWISENAADFWSPVHSANTDILVGAYIRTEGVNTSPANDDERWYVSYVFYDSSGALIGETKLPIDQSVATSGAFIADTNAIGQTILPVDSWTTIMKFVGGKDATGTVWADDFMFYGRGGAWAGQNWNTSVGVPDGWIYWLPPIGGNDGRLSNGFENTIVTTEEAYSGLNSLKFDLPFTRGPQDAWVGTKRFLFGDVGGKTSSNGDISNLESVSPGDVLRISVWIKASNLVPDSAAAYPTTWAAGFTYGFWTGNGNNDGWNSATGGDPVDMQFVFPAVTSFDWTQYNLDVTVPDDPNTRAISVRLHAYSRFTGTVYFDDLTVEKLDVPALTSEVGGFEGDLPSYWTKGNEPGGSTLTWATDQYRSMGRSLKITKSVTTDSAAWISENAADFWSPVHSANTDILVGAYIRTEGVNTSPANDDERWYVSYVFYDSSGALIGETKLPIDQSVATSGAFIADTNAIGQTILPVDSWTTIMKFVGGKDATGTVWADDFMFYGRGGAWAGQNWNTSVGVPDGWIYWLPPIGGNDGRLSNGFENTIVTTEEAYSGLNSLKFDLPFTRGPQDAWVGTKRFLFGDVGGKTSSNGDISNLESVSPGDVLRISVWIKASNLVPDSAAAYPTTWAAGFTYGFWTGNGNNDGWNSATGGDPVDMQFVFPAVTSFDWTQYNLDVTVPDDPNTRAISVRLHAYSRFTGTVYFDDLTVEVIGVTGVDDLSDNLPKTFELENNFPNPFNPTTSIKYGVPRNGNVFLEIFNVLGQRVKILVNKTQPAGRYETIWDGRDEYNRQVGSGIYFYRLQAGNTALVKKMILIK